jgi:hypothetical protein
MRETRGLEKKGRHINEFLGSTFDNEKTNGYKRKSRLTPAEES